jgi:hypothetical protein
MDFTAPEPENGNLYQSSGIRKAILLVRFTEFFKRYIDLRGSETSDENLAIFQVRSPPRPHSQTYVLSPL